MIPIASTTVDVDIADRSRTGRRDHRRVEAVRGAGRHLHPVRAGDPRAGRWGGTDRRPADRRPHRHARPHRPSHRRPTATVYEVAWVAQRVGLGLDHTAAGLVVEVGEDARWLTFQVVLDQCALHRLLESPSGDVGKEMTRRTLKVHRAAVRLCAVDTGRLRSSITWRLGTDARGLVGIVGTSRGVRPVSGVRDPVHGRPAVPPAGVGERMSTIAGPRAAVLAPLRDWARTLGTAAGSRVYAHGLPQAPTFPCVSLTKVGLVPDGTVTEQTLIQADCFAGERPGRRRRTSRRRDQTSPRAGHPRHPAGFVDRSDHGRNDRGRGSSPRP